MCDVPSIAVFCSESIECFPGTASKFFLKLLVTIPVAPIIIGILLLLLLLLLLYFRECPSTATGSLLHVSLPNLSSTNINIKEDVGLTEKDINITRNSAAHPDFFISKGGGGVATLILRPYIICGWFKKILRNSCQKYRCHIALFAAIFMYIQSQLHDP